MRVFCNGNIIEKKDVEEIFEPGFLFGWGVFETLRAYNGKVPFLDLHVARLNDGLNALGIEEVKFDFANKIAELLKVNGLEDAYIRITAYKKRESTGVLIYVDKFGYYPQGAYEKGFSAIISPYKRNTQNPFSQIKSLSYLENRMSWHEAQKRNKDEALILNEKELLVGGSRSNLFIVKNEEVITPPLASGAFYGITRKTIINKLNNLRIKVRETELSVEDLYSCDEAFLTSALLQVMPLVECESKVVGKGKVGDITLRVLSQYHNILS
ncbi:MAG: aminotransferase class IV [Candidatus Omnitrophota bacterium]|nr:aminotransferase class IV [Candidatus Omnitrophota bacterium]